MKKSIALLLVFALLMAMFPAVSAATAQEEPMMLSKAASIPEIDVARVMDVAVRAYSETPTGFIVPDFGMYGMTVLKGEPMRVHFHMEREDTRAVLLIYQGYYEDLNENSKLVASGQMTSGGGSQTMTWDTTGLPAGDYTIYYTLVDDAGELVFATLTDVFISDQEIPLEKIGFYVYELGMETDVVRLPLASYHPESLSVAPVRHPYHTTDRRPISIEGVYNAFSTGAGNFQFVDGRGASGFVGRQYLCAYINDGGFRSFLTYLNVDVEEVDDSHVLIYPDEGGVLQYICKGQENVIPIQIPAGESLENALIQTSRPGLLTYRTEGDTLYVTPLVEYCGMETLIVAIGNTFDAISFYVRAHSYRTKTISAATCTEDGLEAIVCEYCGDQEGEAWVVPAKGHVIDAVETITGPKATKDGVGVGYCRRCNQDVEVPVSRIFVDTYPDWFYSDALDYCYENGVINGLTNDTFGPGATLNRAQLVTMLYRHAGSPAVEGENIFTDVPDGQFYTDAVIWASANGIVNGYGDGIFLPAAPITREQIVTMLHRYVVSLGKDNGERNDLAVFTDLDLLHDYAREPMEWAVANGVINGVSATELGPQQSANRAQTVTILYRIITGILEAGENA